jgi:hypothetical protein
VILDFHTNHFWFAAAKIRWLFRWSHFHVGWYLRSSWMTPTIVVQTDGANCFAVNARLVDFGLPADIVASLRH